MEGDQTKRKPDIAHWPATALLCLASQPRGSVKPAPCRYRETVMLLLCHLLCKWYQAELTRLSSRAWLSMTCWSSSWGFDQHRVVSPAREGRTYFALFGYSIVEVLLVVLHALPERFDELVLLLDVLHGHIGSASGVNSSKRTKPTSARWASRSTFFSKTPAHCFKSSKLDF